MAGGAAVPLAMMRLAGWDNGEIGDRHHRNWKRKVEAIRGGCILVRPLPIGVTLCGESVKKKKVVNGTHSKKKVQSGNEKGAGQIGAVVENACLWD